ncbi:MAG: hypothetical protein ACI861_002287, partial [Paracoccaceae bacterium]
REPALEWNQMRELGEGFGKKCFPCVSPASFGSHG